MTTEDDWKRKLTPERYRILRQKGTEPPFSGRLLHNTERGVYACAGCGAELFSHDAKFDSGSGWPSFWQAIDRSSIEEVEDTSHGMRRIEILCRNCKGHLGHVFPDGPRPTGLRYCVNSLSLEFKESLKGEDP